MSTLVHGIPTLAAGPLMDWWYRLNFRGEGRSTHSGESDFLFFWIFAISTFFFVLLMVLMVWFTFKYRRRTGGVPARSPSHNTLMELSWSVIPTIILVWMFFEGFWGYASAVVAPVEAEELVITGQRWSWSVLYPNGAGSGDSVTERRMKRDGGEAITGLAVQEAPVIVVPEGRPISLRMSSKDVIHSFWIPDFRVKFDVFPNRYTSLWFTPKAIDAANAIEGKTKAGLKYTFEDHWVFCAEYCGDNHSEMYAVIRVVPYAAYRAILEEWGKPTGTLWEKGRFYWKGKGCNSCHSVDGSANTGPTWKDMYGYEVKFTDGSSRSAEEMTGAAFAGYVRESVFNPSAKIVAGFAHSMSSFQGMVDDEQLEYLIAYMKHLSDKAPPDGAAPAPTGSGASPTPAPAPTGTPGPTGTPAPTGAPAAPAK
jgi:cytochrome c oxidase subunit 2